MGELVQKKTRQKNKARKDKTKTYSQIQEMNLKDRIFMEFMETCPDGTVKDMQQIVKKYRPQATDSANYLYGWKVLNDSDVKNRISKRNHHRLKAKQLSYEEKLMYLTGVIMGDIEPDAETKDRLKALDIANKMEGVYVNKNVNINQNLTIEDERAIVERRIRHVLGEPIDVEVKEVSSENVEE